MGRDRRPPPRLTHPGFVGHSGGRGPGNRRQNGVRNVRTGAAFDRIPLFRARSPPSPPGSGRTRRRARRGHTRGRAGRGRARAWHRRRRARAHSRGDVPGRPRDAFGRRAARCCRPLRQSRRVRPGARRARRAEHLPPRGLDGPADLHLVGRRARVPHRDRVPPAQVAPPAAALPARRPAGSHHAVQRRRRGPPSRPRGDHDVARAPIPHRRGPLVRAGRRLDDGAGGGARHHWRRRPHHELRRRAHRRHRPRRAIGAGCAHRGDRRGVHLGGARGRRPARRRQPPRGPRPVTVRRRASTAPTGGCSAPSWSTTSARSSIDDGAVVTTTFSAAA